MKINMNSHVFEKGKPKNTLIKNTDNQHIKEYCWSFKNESTYGIVKEIRLKGVSFLAYNLTIYKNDEIPKTNDAPLFKLHFEFDEEIKHEFQGGEKECIIIKKGRYELLYLTQKNNRIESNKETKNSVEIFFDEPFLRDVIGNEFKQLLSFLKDKNKEETLVNYGIFITPEINLIITAIKNCEYTGDKRSVFLELKIKELIIVSLTIYGESYTKNEESICTEETLQNVENYIKLNLKKDLNISKLSVLAGMNTSKFKKCFKQLYGATVFKYITYLRIERAKVLIKQKSYTISQASYEVGYKNAQHFTVAFKKNTGYLPSEFKKKI